MLEGLKYIFSSIWIYFGVLIYIVLIVGAVNGLFRFTFNITGKAKEKQRDDD